jgi:hypothetical protein
MKKFNGDTYVYEMIKNLCPSYHHPFISKKLFGVDDLSDRIKDSHFKYQLIRQLDRTLDLHYEIGSEDERDWNNAVKISSVRTNKHARITISYDSNPPIVVDLNYENGELIGTSPLYVLEEKKGEWDIGHEYRTSIRKDAKGRPVIYFHYVPQNSAVATTDYLDALAPDRIDKPASAELIWTKVDEDDDENLLYQLNFRGFLLFLLNLIHLETNTVFRKYVCQVLSSPRILEIAPFLQYWADFEKAGFDVMHSLKEIALELRTHHEEKTTSIGSSNMAYLVRRATEIYFIRVTNFFSLRIDESSVFSYYYLQDKGYENLQEIRSKVAKYRLSILELLKMWNEEEISLIDDIISSTQMECSEHMGSPARM